MLKISQVYVSPRGSEFIVSGSDDMKVKVWTLNPIKQQLLLVHEFKDLHIGQITQVCLTEDDYLATASVDNSVSLIDLREMKVIHKFSDVHTNSRPFSSSLAVHCQSQPNPALTFLSGSSGEGQLTRIRSDPIYISNNPAAKQNYFSWLATSDIIRKSIKNDQNMIVAPSLRSLEFAFSIQYCAKRWNFLHLIVFLLPNVHPKDYLQAAIDNKIYLTADNNSVTQLDYLLAYKGNLNSQTEEFFANFFQKLPSLLNLSLTNNHQIIQSLSGIMVQIYENHGGTSFLNTFNALISKEITPFILNSGELPASGELNNNVQDFLIVRCNSVDSEEVQKVIKSEQRQKQKRHPLSYTILLSPFNYSLSDPHTLKFLKILDGIESSNLLQLQISNSYSAWP